MIIFHIRISSFGDKSGNYIKAFLVHKVYIYQSILPFWL